MMAMGLPQKKRATYKDLLAVPEHLVAEIIDGDLVTSPRPASRHANASTGLLGALDGPFRRGRGGPGGWIILFEPELHLHGHVIVPDLAGWRRERMPKLLDTAAFELAPDWACEILSRGTAALDRARKMPIYASERVGHIWLIDPIDRTLETYGLRDDGWMLLRTFENDDKARAEPFEAVEFDLGELWAD